MELAGNLNSAFMYSQLLQSQCPVLIAPYSISSPRQKLRISETCNSSWKLSQQCIFITRKFNGFWTQVYGYFVLTALRFALFFLNSQPTREFLLWSLIWCCWQLESLAEVLTLWLAWSWTAFQCMFNVNALAGKKRNTSWLYVSWSGVNSFMLFLAWLKLY